MRVFSDRGDSAVVALVPAAEPVVGRWRERYDVAAAEGMPAHITLLYPFLDESRLAPGVVEELAAICARSAPVDLSLAEFRRFPGVLWLAPEPAEPFRRLTLAIAGHWPEAPPFGGAYDEVVPHLTVSVGAPDETTSAIEADVAPRLPVRTRVERATLFVFEGDCWAERARLPFQADPKVRASST